MMDRQAIYDKVAEHLLEQGVKSIKTDSGSCLYRGPGGRRCAIGCLIPDDLYGAWWEGSGVHRLWGNREFQSTPPEVRQWFDIILQVDESEHDTDTGNPTDIEFLSSLQVIHDQSQPDVWAEVLVNTARQWRLRAWPGAVAMRDGAR